MQKLSLESLSVNSIITTHSHQSWLLTFIQSVWGGGTLVETESMDMDGITLDPFPISSCSRLPLKKKVTKNSVKYSWCVSTSTKKKATATSPGLFIIHRIAAAVVVGVGYRKKKKRKGGTLHFQKGFSHEWRGIMTFSVLGDVVCVSLFWSGYPSWLQVHVQRNNPVFSPMLMGYSGLECFWNQNIDLYLNIECM